MYLFIYFYLFIYLFIRYDIMVRCWNFNPDFRLPFEKLRQRMDSYIREKVCFDYKNWGIIINYKVFQSVYLHRWS